MESAFARLGLQGEPALVFEQAPGGSAPSRHAYLFFTPRETLRVREGKLTRERNGRVTRVAGEPLVALKGLLESYRRAPTAGLPPFACGAVGYLGYDCVRYLENIALPSQAAGEDEACFVLFRHVIVLDTEAREAILVANLHEGETERDSGLDAIAARLLVPETTRDLPPPSDMSAIVEKLVSDGEFAKAIAQVKRHIRQGDIFQCVLSRRQTFRLASHPFAIYRELRRTNPSPYHFYFHSGAQSLTGASPEALVRVSDGEVTTNPIAGTRPRGATPAEDKKLEKSLLRSPKERAEHLMLVDLARNDIGRVCRPGSVRVREFMQVQRFSHVMHLVSTVEGQLGGRRTALDALFAAFPAGTLTGAPKIRAMEIISRLERARRGAYGGAMVLYDFSGRLESCITIRSLVAVNGRGAVQAGAGIVADSTAPRESQEIRNKTRAVERAIQLARRDGMLRRAAGKRGGAP